MLSSLIIPSYLVASSLISPLGRVIARNRIKAGKEDPNRIEERFGFATQKRPEGKLIWLHSASVGESISILSLVKELRKTFPEATIFLTTGTITSARVLKGYLNEKILHQFVPYDIKLGVKRFLEHWKPSIAILVESELWPTLIFEINKRSIPLLLINGRLSSKSLKFWKKYPKAAKALIQKIDFITVQTKDTREELIGLGYEKKQVKVIDTLKQSAKPLPVNLDDLRQFETILSNRIIWVAASTHPGEEELIINAYQSLIHKFKEMFLILVPRHPERGQEIRKLLDQKGFESKLRSEIKFPSEDDKIFIADTLGELGIWYRLAQFAIVGGSLIPKGGHNPYEPALLGCPIIHGSHTFNFAKAYERLFSKNGSLEVNQETVLEDVIEKVMDKNFQKQLSTNALDLVNTNMNSVQKTVSIIKHFLQYGTD